MEGLAEFQLANLLAATAACRAVGVSREVLGKSLSEFSSSTHNPGRVNLYKLNGGHVMVDYGHNSDAFDAVCRMASKWKNRQVTGIITVPGDRDDSLITRAARIAAQGFNKVIVREDHDVRGRRVGEVAQLMQQTVRQFSPSIKCEVVLDEVEALRHAVQHMVKGEVIVHFYEKLQRVQTALQELYAEPATALPPLSSEAHTNASDRLNDRRATVRVAKSGGRGRLRFSHSLSDSPGR